MCKTGAKADKASHQHSIAGGATFGQQLLCQLEHLTAANSPKFGGVLCLKLKPAQVAAQSPDDQLAPPDVKLLQLGDGCQG